MFHLAGVGATATQDTLTCHARPAPLTTGGTVDRHPLAAGRAPRPRPGRRLRGAPGPGRAVLAQAGQARPPVRLGAAAAGHRRHRRGHHRRRVRRRGARTPRAARPARSTRLTSAPPEVARVHGPTEGTEPVPASPKGNGKSGKPSVGKPSANPTGKPIGKPTGQPTGRRPADRAAARAGTRLTRRRSPPDEEASPHHQASPHGEAHGQARREAHGQADRQAHGQPRREAHRQARRPAHGQADRQARREAVDRPQARAVRVVTGGVSHGS